MAGPHEGQPVETRGASLSAAEAAVVLVHGRGSTAERILGLADALPRERTAYLAPQAAGNTWYPNPFTAPVETNEPGRSSGLGVLVGLVEDATRAGIDRDRIAIVGFSQGACLGSEFLARDPTRYGGLAALSGGLIGEAIEPGDYDGDLDGTPVFLGCSDVDPHIPVERVRATAAVFERLGGDVTTRLYEGMGHGINADEREFLAEMIAGLRD